MPKKKVTAKKVAGKRVAPVKKPPADVRSAEARPTEPALALPANKPPQKLQAGKQPPRGTATAKAKVKLPDRPRAQAPVPKALARAMERAGTADASVLDRLAATVLSRRTADPAVSHSARLMARGTAKVAQKFGEEAVECLIEAMTGDRGALVAESADVLYHLVVLWVNAGVAPAEVWGELHRREGISGIAEKARRKILLPTTKIP